MVEGVYRQVADTSSGHKHKPLHYEGTEPWLLLLTQNLPQEWTGEFQQNAHDDRTIPVVLNYFFNTVAHKMYLDTTPQFKMFFKTFAFCDSLIGGIFWTASWVMYFFLPWIQHDYLKK